MCWVQCTYSHMRGRCWIERKKRRGYVGVVGIECRLYIKSSPRAYSEPTIVTIIIQSRRTVGFMTRFSVLSAGEKQQTFSMGKHTFSLLGRRFFEVPSPLALATS